MATSYYSISCDDGTTIETTVTSRASVVGQWLAMINSMYEATDQDPVVVGLDVEWKPNRRSTDDHLVATLQLCVNDRCLIIQLCYLDLIPRSLRRFLRNPTFVFVGVGVEDDTNRLSRHYGLECSWTCDVRDVAVEECPTMFSSYQPGLKEIVQKIVGIHLKKPWHVTMSNWESIYLTYDQVEYACLDAYASCRVGEVLHAGAEPACENWRSHIKILEGRKIYYFIGIFLLIFFFIGGPSPAHSSATDCRVGEHCDCGASLFCLCEC